MWAAGRMVAAGLGEPDEGSYTRRDLGVQQSRSPERIQIPPSFCSRSLRSFPCLDQSDDSKGRRSENMRCPYCGDRRTEVLKTVYRGHSSYRHRRCLYCGSRFSTQERPVRWSRVDRKWPGPRPLRKGWGDRRMPALRGKCEVETLRRGFQTGRNQAPRRPHCSGAAYAAIECRQSRPPRKPSAHLRNLPWVQTPGRSQAVLGG